MLKIPSYISKNRQGTYYFRLVIPINIRNYLNYKREFGRSLQTESKRVAIKRARIMMTEMDKVFDYLAAKQRGENPSPRYIELTNVQLSDGTLIGEVKIDQGTPEQERETAKQFLAGNSAVATATQPTEYEQTLLSVVIDGYCDEMKIKSATEKSIHEYRANLALLTTIVGDVAFSSLKHPQLAQFKQKLIKLPANINKIAAYRGKSIDEVLQMDNVKPMALNTANKYLSRISSLFEWAMKQGYTDKNYASGLGLGSDKKAQDERSEFTHDELKALFESDQYREGQFNHASHYWVPLIALYAGARLNEVCQLSLSDIKCIEGIHVFDINDKGDKKLKNKNSRRQVPIHSTLIKLGFIAYCNQLKLDNHQAPEMEPVELKLFPELKAGRDGYGTAMSRWFGRYRKQVGVTDEGKVFHSFRHTVINHLKQKGVTKEIVAAIVGHTDESETFGRYGSQYTPQVLKEYVEMLQFDIGHFQYQQD